jgi:hypothetical protein
MLLVPSTLIRLRTSYGLAATLCVLVLPVIRPNTLFELLVSSLTRPSTLNVASASQMASCSSRLIVPDNTRAAARIASRVAPLRLVLLLPPLLVGLIVRTSNAMRLTELRSAVYFVTVVRFSIRVTIATFWGDLGPLIPFPSQFNQISGSGSLEVDLSRQDLPRIALSRRGERWDLLLLTISYVVFASSCVQGYVFRQSIASRWLFRSVVSSVVLYTLGGDGSGDIITLLSALSVAELFLLRVITLSNVQRYHQTLLNESL